MDTFTLEFGDGIYNKFQTLAFAKDQLAWLMRVSGGGGGRVNSPDKHYLMLFDTRGGSLGKLAVDKDTNYEGVNTFGFQFGNELRVMPLNAQVVPEPVYNASFSHSTVAASDGLNLKFVWSPVTNINFGRSVLYESQVTINDDPSSTQYR